MESAQMEYSEDYSDSPFLTFIGTKLIEWRDGYARIRLDLQPHHLNRSGVCHGGLLSALMDHGGAFSGLYCTVPGNKRYSMTLSLSANFLAQSRSGSLFVTGERMSGGRKIYFASTEVKTDEGLLVAASTSVHRYRSGSEAPEGLPPAGA
jgi:uncharacterized protein (TIGR00369 family)